MTLTEEQIAKIRARAEAATPGPWKWWTSNSWNRLKSDDQVVTRSVAEPFVNQYDRHPDLSINEADMDFIAHARADIPALLSALEAANKRAEEAEETLAAYGRAREQGGVNEDALRALAQAYDREDAAQRGEPDPWNLDDPGDIGDSDMWVSERLACAQVAAEAFLSAILPEDAAGLVERLRQYEGRQWETTACYNGTRDEAASALSAAYASLAAKDQLIESLMAERDAAQFAARNGDSLSSDAIHAVREMLKGAGVPMAAFIDDHVGNAIVQRNQERTRAEAAEARVVELEKALDALDRMNRGLDWCDHDEQARRWSAARRVLEACGTTEAIEAVAASLSGTPSPIPGDTPK